ncbi:MAG: hypothetical protein ACTSVW_06670, partial [Candidatus Njordarchaeales archaeon]
MSNRIFRKDAFKKIILFITLQVIVIILSPTLQNIFQSFIDYRDPNHLVIIFSITIPYIASIFALPFFRKPLIKAKVDEQDGKVKIDLLLLSVLIVLGIIIYSPHLTKHLPTGYDTPRYICMPEVILLGNLPLDIKRVIYGRYLYSLILLPIFTIISDEFMFGNFLHFQVLLIIVGNYYLLKNLTGYRSAGFVSSFLWLIWNRTLRVTDDLHANTFAIFLVILAYYFFIKEFNKGRSLNLRIFSIFVAFLTLILFVHGLTAIVFSATFLSYLVLNAFNTYFTSHRESRQYVIRSLYNILRWIFLLSPILFTCGIFLALYCFNIPVNCDLIRRWWPEIPFYNLKAFIKSIGGIEFFLLGELGAIYLILKNDNVGACMFLFLHVLISLLFSQNMILGLHALPERFLVFLFLPIYATLGLTLIAEGIGNALKNIKFTSMSISNRKLKISLIFSKGSTNPRIKKIVLCMIFGLALAYFAPATYNTFIYLGKNHATINENEYATLVYLRDEYVSKLDERKKVLIISQKPGLEMWAAQVLCEIRWMRKDTSPIGIILNWYPRREFLREWDVIYVLPA